MCILGFTKCPGARVYDGGCEMHCATGYSAQFSSLSAILNFQPQSFVNKRAAFVFLEMCGGTTEFAAGRCRLRLLGKRTILPLSLFISLCCSVSSVLHTYTPTNTQTHTHTHTHTFSISPSWYY